MKKQKSKKMQNNNSEKDRKMSESQPRIPKPFSIESLIASKTPERSASSSAEAVVSITPPPIAFPGDINLMAGAANAIYNPWIHNYFMQHRKLSEQFADSSAIATNLVHLREKTSEMLFDNLNAHDSATGLAQSEHRRQLLEQYFGGGGGGLRDPKISGMLSNGSEFYKNYGGFLAHHYSDGESVDQFHERNKVFSVDSASGNILTNLDSGDSAAESRIHPAEDSGTDDINEMDSDCSSESSVNTSPDGENIQGSCSFGSLDQLHSRTVYFGLF